MHRAFGSACLGGTPPFTIARVDIAQDRTRFRQHQIAIDDEGRLAARMDMLEIFKRSPIDPRMAVQLVLIPSSSSSQRMRVERDVSR